MPWTSMTILRECNFLALNDTWVREDQCAPFIRFLFAKPFVRTEVLP